MTRAVAGLALAAALACVAPRAAVSTAGTAQAPPAHDRPAPRGEVYPGLRARIEATHLFLRRHRGDAPFAQDPRPLEPFSEVVRLQACTQALGYLNLYRLTGSQPHLREAEVRLDHILAVGDSAYSDAPLDGQIGYAFLLASELGAGERFREAGLEVARRCAAYRRSSIPNQEYASALALGKAFRATGQGMFLEAARRITRHVAGGQYPDGAFPHVDRWGENTHYTVWLVAEMLLHRRDDPTDPDMDLNLVRAVRFLARRVNPDGSLNYEDSLGSYNWNGVSYDCRGWVNELPALALDLLALGRVDEASSVLRFLFAQEMSGEDRGGYPDKWGYLQDDPWSGGRPSVLRTSLVFWLLTSIALMEDPHVNGTQRACTVTPLDCNPAYRQLGVCSCGEPGLDTFIDGRWTGCMDEERIAFQPEPWCWKEHVCTYDPEIDVSIVADCWHAGTVKCVGATCEPACEPDAGVFTCDRWDAAGNACLRGPARGSGAAAARRADEPAAPSRVLAVRPNPVLGAFALAFESAEAGPVRLELFDVAGRLVRDSGPMLLALGPHTWSPPASEGLPAGTYLARLRQGGRGATVRLVVIR